MSDIKEIESAIEVTKTCLEHKIVGMTDKGWERIHKLQLQALQEKLERENPQPLTLGELREMEGKPVWVETMQQWRIVTINRENNYLVCLLAEYNTISAKHVFNNDGRVYLHKPKEKNNA